MKYICLDNAFKCGGKEPCLIDARIEDARPPEVCPYEWGVIHCKKYAENAVFPAWLKVGAWVWCSDFEYGIVTKIADDTTVIIDFIYRGKCSEFIENIRPARVNQRNINEPDLLGVKFKADMTKTEYAFAVGFFNKYSRPCGILEHLNDKGEWMR